MITALYIIFRIIVAILALIVIWDIIRDKSLPHIMCLGIVSIPLILRALMIK